MAHEQQIDFCVSIKKRHPYFFENSFVLDIGSLDINGSNQYLFEDCHYLGVDVSEGKNVDVLSKGHEVALPDQTFDVVISTECFEHDPFYEKTIRNAYRLLKPGGLLLFTCATTGRKEHGTRRTTPNDAPLIQAMGEWADYYKNLEEAHIRQVLDIENCFGQHGFSTNTQSFDLYFWGIKQGQHEKRSDYSHMFSLPRTSEKRALQEVERLKAELEDLTETLSVTSVQLNEAKAAHNLQINNIGRLEELLQLRDDRLRADANTLLGLRTQLDEALDAKVRARQQSSDLIKANSELEDKLGLILGSKSWIYTKPARFAARLARGDIREAAIPVLRRLGLSADLADPRRIRNGLRYLRKGNLSGLTKRIAHLKREAALGTIGERMAMAAASAEPDNAWGILTTSHTLFIAESILENLSRHGILGKIITSSEVGWPRPMYFVLCAQMFKDLPPGERRVCYQLEQSINSRWFTPGYLNTLESSFAVLDYSLENLEYLASKNIRYPMTYYLPVGARRLERSREAPPTYDLVFYGDYKSSPRRQKLLKVLGENFKLLIIDNVFGEELRSLVKSASAVVNLHYYEGALLETPRIMESISWGMQVISEGTVDQDQYPELKDAVTFFENGSEEDMLAKVTKLLTHSGDFQRIESVALASSTRFSFMFDRFLVGLGILPSAYADEIQIPITLSGDEPEVVLSLPETIARRKEFLDSSLRHIQLFDGIRRTPGWVGCALSYKVLSRHALATNKKTLTVMEDDVLVSDDFLRRKGIVRKYLQTRSDWDVFAGLIALVREDTKVISVETFEGEQFVTIDRMTSMVYNVYAPRLLKILSAWDPTNLDSKTNTIDKFIESQINTRVVVAIPFLVGHHEELDSTLWGFNNTQYKDLIAEAQERITRLSLEYQKRLAI